MDADFVIWNPDEEITVKKIKALFQIGATRRVKSFNDPILLVV